MGRAELRRAAREQKKSLQPVKKPDKQPVSLMVRQKDLNKVKNDIISDLSGDVAREAYYKGLAEGYEAGYEQGREHAVKDYCNLFYHLFGLALWKHYGFKAKRIYRVFRQLEEWCAEIVKVFSDKNVDQEDIYKQAHDALEEKTGLDIWIK